MMTEKYTEAIYFNYWLNVADCYVGTSKDPYCYDIKGRKRSMIFTRKGWINDVL